MGFFKKITKIVAKSTLLPVAAVVGVGYAAYKVSNRGTSAKQEQSASSSSEAMQYQESGCSSNVPPEVAALRSQAESYDKRISMFQSGLNSENKDNAYSKCASSDVAKDIRMNTPMARTAQALCASNQAQQTQYLYQSRQLHDQMYEKLKSSPDCKMLADAADQLAPLNALNEKKQCQVNPSVAEISADADRTWDGMKKLEAKVAQAKAADAQAQAQFANCKSRNTGVVGRGVSSASRCAQPAMDPIVACLKNTSLENALGKIKGMNRAVQACRANYDQEYRDLAQVKEYEAGFRLAMSGNKACDALSGLLVNAPIPARDLASSAQETRQTTADCRPGTICGTAYSSPNAVK